MTIPIAKSQYLLLFRGIHWDRNLSPEQIQQIMGKWAAWHDRVARAGSLRAGQPLEPEGRVITGRNGATVTDGPFAEAKEAIAGYFLIEAEDLDAATRMARECPTLEHGIIVEVRPIAGTCPSFRRAQESVATEVG